MRDMRRSLFCLLLASTAAYSQLSPAAGSSVVEEMRQRVRPDMSPEARIALVDEIIARETARPAVRPIPQAQREPVVIESPAPSKDEPSKQIQAIRASRVSPEEIIRQVDLVLPGVEAAERSQRLARRPAAPAPTAPAPVADHPMRAILETTKTLTPEARIASVDARGAELKAAEERAGKIQLNRRPDSRP